MSQTRRSVLSALGLALPLGVASAAADAGGVPRLTFRRFEDAVREAFAGVDPSAGTVTRRVEVGHCDELREGAPGCVNDRPFAGFAPGTLRIARVAAEPGQAVGGVRLYVAAVDVVVGDGRGGRLMDFSAFPPAPSLS